MPDLPEPGWGYFTGVGFMPPEDGGFIPPDDGGFIPPDEGGFMPPELGGFMPGVGLLTGVIGLLTGVVGLLTGVVGLLTGVVGLLTGVVGLLTGLLAGLFAGAALLAGAGRLAPLFPWRPTFAAWALAAGWFVRVPACSCTVTKDSARTATADFAARTPAACQI